MRRKGLGVGSGKQGYYNLVPNDPYIHSLSARGISLVQNPKFRTAVYHQGIFQNESTKDNPEPLTDTQKKRRATSINKIKSEIYDLLYEVKKYKGESATEIEEMTIIVLKSKAHHFDFLKSNTEWNAIGNWKDNITDKNYDKEKNEVIKVMYLDTKSELIGKRLKTLLERLNNYEIGEWMLYYDSKDVDDTSLKLKKHRTKIIN